LSSDPPTWRMPLLWISRKHGTSDPQPKAGPPMAEILGCSRWDCLKSAEVESDSTKETVSLRSLSASWRTLGSNRHCGSRMLFIQYPSLFSFDTKDTSYWPDTVWYLGTSRSLRSIPCFLLSGLSSTIM